jgi:hypothetical protein
MPVEKQKRSKILFREENIYFIGDGTTKNIIHKEDMCDCFHDRDLYSSKHPEDFASWIMTLRNLVMIRNKNGDR